MSKSSKLFEESLKAAHAGKYSRTLRYHRIHEKDLSMVTEHDLIRAGVNEEHIRDELLNYWRNMDIDNSSNDDIAEFAPNFNNESINNALMVISKELNVLHAYLSYAANQKKVLRTDVILSPATNHLLEITTKVQDEIQSLRNEVVEEPITTSKKNNWRYAIAATISALASIYLMKRYLTS